MNSKGIWALSTMQPPLRLPCPPNPLPTNTNHQAVVPKWTKGSRLISGQIGQFLGVVKRFAPACTECMVQVPLLANAATRRGPISPKAFRYAPLLFGYGVCRCFLGMHFLQRKMPRYLSDNKPLQEVEMPMC